MLSEINIKYKKFNLEISGTHKCLMDLHKYFGGLYDVEDKTVSISSSDGCVHLFWEIWWWLKNYSS